MLRTQFLVVLKEWLDFVGVALELLWSTFRPNDGKVDDSTRGHAGRRKGDGGAGREVRWRLMCGRREGRVWGEDCGRYDG